MTYPPAAASPPAFAWPRPGPAITATSARHGARDTFVVDSATWHKRVITNCPKCPPTPSLVCAALSRDWNLQDMKKTLLTKLQNLSKKKKIKKRRLRLTTSRCSLERNFPMGSTVRMSDVGWLSAHRLPFIIYHSPFTVYHLAKLQLLHCHWKQIQILNGLHLAM